MTDWPAGLSVGPLREWPGRRTPDAQRRRSPFTRAGSVSYQRVEVSLSDTLVLLDRELESFGRGVARSAVLLVAIPPEQFRLDGRPRASAKAEHPGVVLSFDAPNVGNLSFPCDQFTTWTANLRAIALSLEALRKVDRYGVTRHGEQFRGFLAIESGRAMPAGFASVNEVDTWLHEVSPGSYSTIAEHLRLAKRDHHPDLGGDDDTFARVMDAERYLRQAGALS